MIEKCQLTKLNKMSLKMHINKTIAQWKKKVKKGTSNFHSKNLKDWKIISLKYASDWKGVRDSSW